MKKLPLALSSLIFILFAVNAQAHGYGHSRANSQFYLSNSYPHYSAFPSASVIAGINYRNYNRRIGVQNRYYNSQLSSQRAYQRGYRNGYQDAQREQSAYSRHNRYNSNSCYEVSYDRHGNRVRRNLPASACRH